MHHHAHTWLLSIPLTVVGFAIGYAVWALRTWDARWEERRKEGLARMRTLPLFLWRPINNYREWRIKMQMEELLKIYSAESARNYVIWKLDESHVIDRGEDTDEIAGLRGAKLYWVQPDAISESLIALEVVNSSPEPDGSYKRYLIRCDLRLPLSVRACAARSFGFIYNELEYKPVVET